MKIWQLTLYGNQGYQVEADTIAGALNEAFRIGVKKNDVYMIKQVPYHPQKDDDVELPTRAEVSG